MRRATAVATAVRRSRPRSTSTSTTATATAAGGSSSSCRLSSSTHDQHHPHHHHHYCSNPSTTLFFMKMTTNHNHGNSRISSSGRILFSTMTTTTTTTPPSTTATATAGSSPLSTTTTTTTTENNELLQRAIRLAQLDLPHESQILFDLLMKQLTTMTIQLQELELELQQDQGREKEQDHDDDDGMGNNVDDNDLINSMMIIQSRDLSRLQTTLMDSWIKYQTKLVQQILDDERGEEGELHNDDDDNVVDRLKEIHHAAECLTKIFESTVNTSTTTTATNPLLLSSSTATAPSASAMRSSMSSSSSSSSSHMLLAVLKAWANVCESSHYHHHNTPAAIVGDSSSSSSSSHSSTKRRPTNDIQSIVAGIPQRMQHLLLQQQQHSNTTTVTVEMNNEILKAWAYSFEYLRGTMAQQMFETQMSSTSSYPNLQSYRYMILAYAWSYETRSAFNATGYYMRLMKRLEREAPSISPRRYYYDPEDDDDYDDYDDRSVNRTATSDVLSLDDYHVLVNSWTKAGDKHAPSKVCTVLEIMNDAYKNGLSSVRPDLTCYRDALITVSRRQQLPEVGELADTLLNELQRPENQHSRSFMHPDTECYRAAIVSWKHTAMARDTTNPEYAIQRCFDILREMREAFYRTTQVTVQSTTYDFNNVLHALSLSSKHRVQVLRQGQVLFQALLDEAATTGGPDADSYRYLLTIIRKSSSNEKLELASKLIETLRLNMDTIKKSSSDDSIVGVFNAYIRVCASIGGQNSRGKSNPKNTVESHTEPLQSDQDKAMTVALRSIDEIPKRHGLVPNPGTYEALIEVVDKLLPVDGTRRAQVLEQVFRRACSEGCVDQLLLERLKTAASTYQYADLVISRSVEMDNVKVVPAQWTRNVKGFKEGKKVMPLSIHGSYHFSKEAAEYRMRNLRRRNNQALLRGGRMK